MWPGLPSSPSTSWRCCSSTTATSSWSPAPASRSCSSPSTWPCKTQPSAGSAPAHLLPRAAAISAQDMSTVSDWFSQGESLSWSLHACYPIPSLPPPLFISTAAGFRGILQVWQVPSPAGVDAAGHRQGEDLSRGEDLCRGPCATAANCRAWKAVSSPGSDVKGMNFSVPTQAGLCSFSYFGVENILPPRSQDKAETTSCGWRGDQCLTNNSTYFEITAGNTTLVKHAKTHQTMGTLMNLSSEDILLIQYQLQRERTYSGLYLYARNLSVSTAHREEFEHHAKRLGLSEEEIVYAPWKMELCQVKDEKGNSPRTEPAAAVTASSPPPGTHQPGSTGN
ncbi:uncharacterized protein LOC141932556 isoform X1 [Strix aluco]|uniref:uncharacterized protein LOC141932556 isoform X1 n=1 Tax=Strix aluco TaxID=111821 RepID=UPI003DA5062A